MNDFLFQELAPGIETSGFPSVAPEEPEKMRFAFDQETSEAYIWNPNTKAWVRFVSNL